MNPLLELLVAAADIAIVQSDEGPSFGLQAIQAHAAQMQDD